LAHPSRSGDCLINISWSEPVSLVGAKPRPFCCLPFLFTWVRAPMGWVQRELGHGHGVRGGLAWLPMSLAPASVTMALARVASAQLWRACYNIILSRARALSYIKKVIYNCKTSISHGAVGTHVWAPAIHGKGTVPRSGWHAW
jgi:hypothetical protein